MGLTGWFCCSCLGWLCSHSQLVGWWGQLILLGRKLGMSTKGWPSWKRYKLISKPHPRHILETQARFIEEETPGDLGHQSGPGELTDSCYKITTETSPTPTHVPLRHSCVLKWPWAAGSLLRVHKYSIHTSDYNRLNCGKDMCNRVCCKLHLSVKTVCPCRPRWIC